MLASLIVIYAVGEVFVAAESNQEKSVTVGENLIKPNQGALSFYASFNNKPHSINKTFYEKDDNPLRVPDKFYEQQKKKSKVTKSPKRTIQKIIKNGRSRSRKIYVHAATGQPKKITSEDVEIQKSNTQNSKEDIKPTEHTHKKKPKKSLKVARYPMPFHKFQTKINAHKRNRRDIGRNDVFIIKDLDEVEFLSKDNDYDVVRTHVQNYW